MLTYVKRNRGSERRYENAEEEEYQINYRIDIYRQDCGADEYGNQKYDRHLNQAAGRDEDNLSEQNALAGRRHCKELVQISENFIEHQTRASRKTCREHGKHQNAGRDEVQIIIRELRRQRKTNEYEPCGRHRKC